MATLVLTVIGDDRSGLVKALAATIAGHGGNWERSHMSHLAGKFAGIVVATVPDGREDDLARALQALDEDGLLHVTSSVAIGELGPPMATAMLEVVGQDRPGIVQEISQALAAREVSITDLESATRAAPMGGGTLFEATAHLQVPADVDLEALGASLEDIANELMVDVELTEER